MTLRIDINVRLDLSERLAALVKPFHAGGIPAPVEAAPEPAPVEAAPEPAPVEAAPEPAPVEAAPEPAPVEAAPEPAPVEAAYPTEADIRAAMRAVRLRIEGNDYETNTRGEGYTKYHRALTGEFKRISALFGSDRPSQLAPEQRQHFIDAISELQADAEKGIYTPEPF